MLFLFDLKVHSTCLYIFFFNTNTPILNKALQSWSVDSGCNTQVPADYSSSLLQLWSWSEYHWTQESIEINTLVHHWETYASTTVTGGTCSLSIHISLWMDDMAVGSEPHSCAKFKIETDACKEKNPKIQVSLEGWFGDWLTALCYILKQNWAKLQVKVAVSISK